MNFLKLLEKLIHLIIRLLFFILTISPIEIKYFNPLARIARVKSIDFLESSPLLNDVFQPLDLWRMLSIHTIFCLIIIVIKVALIKHGRKVVSLDNALDGRGVPFMSPILIVV
jgi:hypothetical protein